MNIVKLPALFITLFAAVCLLTAGLAVKAAEENKNAPPEKANFSRFIGETLVYSIKWDPPWYMFFLPKMEAGEMTFRFQGMDEFRGKPAVKIVVVARSSGTLARLANMEVEDEFLFYSNPETLCAEGSVSKIREGKRKRLLELEYFQDERRAHFRAFDESVTPPVLQRDVAMTDLPPCIQDPFTALYFYSTLPLAKGYAKNLIIGNDDKVLEVRTRIEKQEPVDTPAGKFTAWKVGTDALREGLFRENGDFRIWISADERKALVRFDAKVRLGYVLGVLKSAESP
ncbi:MAG: DUF3108 domain-containing protein [Acidobacteria bacterium]|nr:DUF3108 domain-containing protein [Acidobacteriota bacterium]